VISTKPHGKRKNSAQTATRRLSTIPQIVSLLRQTRTNAPRDGASNAKTDRDWGHKIMTQHYANGFVKINYHVHQRKLLYTIIGPHWLAKSKS
jgi:hypothetical protein